MAALTFCYDTLRTGGHFVCKYYQGNEEKDLELRLKKLFEKVHREKPESSRNVSVPFPPSSTYHPIAYSVHSSDTSNIATQEASGLVFLSNPICLVSVDKGGSYFLDYNARGRPIVKSLRYGPSLQI